MDPKDIKKDKKKRERNKDKDKERVSNVSSKKNEQVFFKKGEPYIVRNGKLIPLSEVSDICL